MLILPGVLLTTGAGFVFGVVEGSIVVVLGTTLGSALAFLIARHLFGARAAHYVRSHPRLKLVKEEMAAHGWIIVLLIRLIPFFPSKISNYFFGLTSFSFRGYVAGSLIGFIPFSVHSVYLGSIAADIATLDDGVAGQCVVVIAGTNPIKPVIRDERDPTPGTFYFRLQGAQSWTADENDTLSVCLYNGYWFETSRSVNH